MTRVQASERRNVIMTTHQRYILLLSDMETRNTTVDGGKRKIYIYISYKYIHTSGKVFVVITRRHCTPLLSTTTICITLLIIITTVLACVTDEHCHGGGTTTGDRG